MYTQQKYRPVSRKKMNSVIERRMVSGVGLGLGEVDGLFNIGKMFTRMFTFTPSSFKLSNIAGAIGSVVTTVGSGGLVAFAPKIQSAHSTISKDVGYGVAAAGAAVGLYLGGSALLSTVGGGAGKVAATGTGLIGTASAGSTEIAAALAPEAGGGFFSAVGNGLSTVGSGLMTGLKAIGSVLPFMGQVMGGGGGGQQQQVQDYGPTQPTADQVAAQAAYDAQQAAMYAPGGYNPNIPYTTPQYSGPMAPSMDTSYGDLRSPYTAIAEDGSTVQIDPITGKVIPPVGISTGTMVMLGGIVFAIAGWYYFTPNLESKT